MGNSVNIDLALDNLSIIVDEEDVGAVAKGKLGKGGDPDGVVDVMDLSYKALHDHLVKLYEDPSMNWENKRTHAGILAMMELVGASAGKLALLKHRPSFIHLTEFYEKKFAPRFESEEGRVEVTEGLKNFEAVLADEEYELFYIRNEDGEPYFTPDLLRNMRLHCNFSLDDDFEEDPLLKVRALQDRDWQASAIQVAHECDGVIRDYYKIAHKLEENELSKSIGMAVLALNLAANPRNLLQNTNGKSSLLYFTDFHKFVRRALKTTEYQRLVAYAPEDKTEQLLLYIVHAFCHALFSRVGGVREEAIGLIYRTMRKGEEEKQKNKKHLVKGDTIWNQFIIDDEKFRTLLSKFPNGPLFKTLDLIREEEGENNNETITPFDPIGQDNLPTRLYQAGNSEVYKLPCPTRQSYINKADVSEDFKGFLRSFRKDQKHLIINLQDKTSWKEYARVKALETLSQSAEFSTKLSVVSLAKDTDFYHQSGEYLNLHESALFTKALIDEVSSENTGYYFPPQLKIRSFAEELVPKIHKHIFSSEKTLSRPEREDFIEIFHQFIVLHALNHLHPTSFSFTCKDAVDTGAAASALFYGFLKGPLSKEEQDFLRFLLYAPALFIRERAIHPARFSRAISALSRLSESDLKVFHISMPVSHL